MKSIRLGYKQEKARLVLEMKDTADHLIRSTKVPLQTGRKWRVPAELGNTISSLQHKEVMGSTQTGRAGLGWAAPQQFWSKATKRKWKTMVVDEVTRVHKGDIPGQSGSLNAMGGYGAEAHWLGRHRRED